MLKFIVLAGLSAAASIGATSQSSVDILIIGAGPAGLTLANRLSKANLSFSIQVLEAGPDPTGDPYIYIPGNAFSIPGQYFWNFTSTPQKVLDGRSVAVTQAHVLGGGTSVNDMQYGRGAPSIYDRWAEISGDEGWKWENLLPHFKDTTRLVLSNRSYSPTTDPSAYGNGPVIVSYNKDIDAFSPYFVKAFTESGDIHVPEIDLNAGFGIGATYTTNTVRQSNATRDSALVAWGYALANRPNVTIQHNSWVKKINFNGNRAVSATYVTSTGNTHTIRAREIILSAGAINSPKLLMLSGVGPASHLKKLGIPLVADIPAIGQNNYDHHFSFFEVNVSRSVLTVPEWNANATLDAEVLKQYNRHARGPLATPLNSGAAFIRVPDDVLRANNASWHLHLAKDRPHIMYQYVILPSTSTDYPNANIVSIYVVLVAPEASGSVHLASSDHRDNPVINPNYYGSPGDKACMLWAYKYARELFSPGPSQPLVYNEVFPGPNVTTDEQVWEVIQQTSGSYDHPVGTVAMGKAVGRDMRVTGLKGIRVVDSSTIPEIPSCWLEGPMYAIGSRVADVILEGWDS